MKHDNRVIRHLFFFVVVMLAGATLLASPPSITYAEGQMTLLPEGKKVVQEKETTIQLVLKGFARDEPLVLWQTFPDYTVVPIGTYRADRGGNRVITLNMGSTAYPLGTHHITLRSSKTGQVIVESFELLAPVIPASPETIVIVEPTNPRQNETIRVRGNGYTKESIAIWLTYPDGRVRHLRYRDAGRQGDWKTEFRLGEQDPTGTYFITGKGLASGRMGVGTFVLERGSVPPVQGIATIEVTPSVVRQLEAIQLSGSGFMPNEVVSLWLTESNGTVWAMRSHKTDSHGAFRTGRMRIEALLTAGGSPIGQTSFTAYGQSSKRIAITEVLLLAGSQFGD